MRNLITRIISLQLPLGCLFEVIQKVFVFEKTNWKNQLNVSMFSNSYLLMRKNIINLTSEHFSQMTPNEEDRMITLVFQMAEANEFGKVFKRRRRVAPP